MKRLCVAGLLAAGSAFGVYQYWFTDNLTSINGASWTQNGTVTATANGLTGTTTDGGSLISKVAVPDLQNDYEVKTTLRVTHSGGYYMQYLGASADARLGPTSTGTFLAIEAKPLVVSEGCWVDVNVYRRVGGVLELLTTTCTECSETVTIRSLIQHDNNLLLVYVNEILYFYLELEEGIPVGQPGVGVRETPSGNSITSVAFGVRDRIPPPAVDAQSIAVAAFPNRVDFDWQGVVDDAEGIGLYGYGIFRDNYAVDLDARLPWQSTVSDPTVTAGHTYNYQIGPTDFHFSPNGFTSFSVTTPPAGAVVDPRRVGVRTNGSYWGAMGEQIDMQSGNLNYTLPVVKAMGRNGKSVTFALSYNSQNWRQDGTKSWKLGSDVGYGFGWRLMAGSLIGYWTDMWTVHHWVFTDATGAEYRLDVNSNGVWTSQEGMYVWYDQEANKLYFPDGSFWVMGCISGGTEPDVGTRYPTVIEDTNGNQILVKYESGMNTPWEDSSARIQSIEDVRARVDGNGNILPTYTFYYDNGHLSRYRSTLDNLECMDFYYRDSEPLRSPWGVDFGTTALLDYVKTFVGSQETRFEYGANDAGELTKVILPKGGELRWQYQNFTYAGSRKLREVQYRWLVPSSGATALEYTLAHPDSTGVVVHSQRTVKDPNGTARLKWGFETAAGAFNRGLVKYEQSERVSDSYVYRRKSYTWAQDGIGRPYITAVDTTLDYGTAQEKTSSRTQAVDVYGNPVWSQLYDYGSSTPTRTYTYSYLDWPHCIGAFVFDHVATVNVDDGGGAVTLVSNEYDSYSLTPRSGLRQYAYGTKPCRGNLSRSTTGGVTTTYQGDITGMATSVSDGTTTTTVSPANNNAVPDLITTGSLGTDLDWTETLQLSKEEGPNNEAATMEYDSAGRPERSTMADGAVTTYTYSNGTSWPATQTATLAGTDGRYTKTTYDGLGRVKKVEQGNTSGVKTVVEREYTTCACAAAGKLWRVTQPYAPGGTTYWTTYSYDAMGRTVSVAHAGGSGTTTYAYSGNTVTVTDPAGDWKKYWMDVYGNLVRVNEPKPGGGTVDTYYTYTLRDQLAEVSMTRDGVTQVRTWNYNRGNGRLDSAMQPETGTVSYLYNADGTVQRKTDARGMQVNYTYDSYKRVTAMGGYTYTYDTDVMGVGSYAAGRLSKVSYDVSDYITDKITEMYAYNQAGRVTKKRVEASKGSKKGNLDVDYTWDTEGRMTSSKWPGSSDTYTYEFDAMGRPNKLKTGPSNILVKDVLYGPAGELTQIKISMHTETRSYNARGQLTRLTVAIYGGDDIDLEYRYSGTQNDGLTTQMKDWVSGEEVTYQYDELKRLTSAVTTGPEWGLNFSHDGFGNRTGQSVVKGSGPVSSLTYNQGTNRLTGAAYGYDAAGNLTAMPGPGPGCAMTLTYDAYNRMSTVNAGSCGYEKYAYGPENRRMWKWRLDDEKEVVYLYGIGGERLGVYKVVEYTSSLGLVTEERALYFGGRRVRTDRTAGLGSEEEEFADRLGSVVWREGTRMSYYPYGEEKGTTTEQGRDKFGTYHRDEVTGLDYAVNRYYGSGLGRFLSADPYDGSGAVKSPQSWNRYGYVRGDPVNFSDPSGLLPCPAGYFYNHEIEDCQPSYVPSPGPHGQDTLPQDPEPLPASMWTNTDHPGIQAAASTLVSLIGWVPEGTCRDFLTQLAGGAGISTDDLISQFQAAAKEAVSFVYDGPSSSRNLDPDDFPGAAGPGVTTVGQWFGADRKREGLSQFNGAAIWIRQDDWNGWGSGYFAGSAPTAYGRGTMMHELLHKASVGGGFSHSQMNAALEAVGAPVRDLYKNEISSPLGKICF